MARAKAPKNGTSRIKKTASASKPAAVETNGVSSVAELESEIRLRAYLLSEQRGFEPGHEQEDWIVAEQEILTRHNQHNA